MIIINTEIIVRHHVTENKTQGMEKIVFCWDQKLKVKLCYSLNPKKWEVLRCMSQIRQIELVPVIKQVLKIPKLSNKSIQK